MKTRIALLVAAIFLVAGNVFAAGSVTYDITKVVNFHNERVVEHVFSWVADSADGSVPATATSAVITGYVFMAVTNPGTTAPTDDYDITLKDADGVDIFGGELVNRDTANSEQTVPKIGGTVYGSRYVNSILTLAVTNNSVHSATGEITFYVYTD